ncbi:uncharacterized protein SCHCODRAFT_02522180, partial [Schizophyllum commune H4-8]|uniref:uncharacterized protein n=1 Tax=Schizophyllum commune (strain H4-8 / FGSC 9210) TaxID=578458 RepID=UPI00215ECC38
NPELLDLVRARKKASGVAAEPKLAYEASKSAELWHAIDDWREDMCERGHAECSMGPECFLPTYIVDKMAILKRDNMQQHARKLLKSQWLFWDKFGQQLVDYVVDQSSHHHDDDASLPIPPTQIPSADLSACTEPVDQPPQSTVSAPDALRSGRGGTAPANTRKRAGTKTANDPAKPKRKRGAPKPREVPHVAGEGVSASEAASSTKRGRMRGGPIDDMRGTKKQKVAEEGAAPSRAVGGRMNEVLQPPTAATSNAQQESLAGGPPTARPIAPAPDRCSTGAQAAMHDGLAVPYARAHPPPPLAAHVRDDADSHAARAAAYRFSGYPSASQFLRAHVERDQSDGPADLRPRREAYPPPTWQQSSTPSMSTFHHSSTSQHALPTPPSSAHRQSLARGTQLGTLVTPVSQREYMASPDTSHHHAPPYFTDRPTSSTLEHHRPPPPSASSRGGWYTRPSAAPSSLAMTAFFEQPVMQIVDYAPAHGASLKLDAVTLASKCIVSQLGGACWIDQTMVSGKVRVVLSHGQTRIVDVVQRATVICACARGLHGSRSVS